VGCEDSKPPVPAPILLRGWLVQPLQQLLS
jgi:hypothetical protein